MSDAPQPTPQPASPERRRALLALSLYALLVVGVFAHQVHGRGVLSSPTMLGIELHAAQADDGTLYPWEQGEVVPFRYRPLFRWIVLGAWELSPGQDPLLSFYWAFVVLSALSLWAAAWCTDWYLRGLGLSGGQAAAGTVMFLAGFPIVFAYDIPVHTREDLLGFASIALTLGCVARGKLREASALACVGVWIRETCLLGILPVWFLRPRPERAWAYYVAPGLSFLAARVARHDPSHAFDLVALIQNSVRPQLDWPGEAALYAFAAFGALWVAAGLRLAQREAPQHPLLAGRVLAVAGVTVVLTGWVMGMIRENRITYILFPWVIPLATLYLCTPRAQALRRKPAAWIAGAVVLALGAGLMIAVVQRPFRINAVRTVIGENFHLGVGPNQERHVGGEHVSLDLVYAPPKWGSPPQLFSSRANGPFVIWHLAFAAALLAGVAASRRDAPRPPGARLE